MFYNIVLYEFKFTLVVCQVVYHNLSRGIDVYPKLKGALNLLYTLMADADNRFCSSEDCRS